MTGTQPATNFPKNLGPRLSSKFDFLFFDLAHSTWPTVGSWPVVKAEGGWLDGYIWEALEYGGGGVGVEGGGAVEYRTHRFPPAAYSPAFSFPLPQPCDDLDQSDTAPAFWDPRQEP